MRQALRNAMAKQAVALGVFALSGCGGFGGSSGGSVIPPSTTKPPTTIALSSGNSQSALVGTAVANPLTVMVTAADGSAVAGVTVSFLVTSGGGSLSAASGTTDTNGLARTILTVGPAAGANTVTASASGSSGPLSGSPVTFTETGTSTPPPPPPSGPTYVNDLAPLFQSACSACHTPGAGAYSGSDLSTYAAVTNGTSRFGYTPAAYVSAGNPSASLLLTKCSGVTQGSQMPPGGPYLTAAQLGTVSTWIQNGAPYSSSGGGATQIQKTSGDAQTATAGALLPNPLVVTILDASSKPVSGVTVSWAITAGNGSLSASSSTSGSNGQASINLTLGTMAGMNTVTASSSGLTGSPITFSETGTAGPARTIALVSGDAQSGVAGSALSKPCAVKVTDAANNPVQGFSVTFSVTSGGGSGNANPILTDATGQAAWTLTLGKTAGTNTAQATATGLAGSPVNFTETGLAGSASQIALVSGNGQSGVAGSTLPNALVAKVTDANGNPVSGFAVGFSIAMGAGTLSASNVNTDATGQASTKLTLDKAAGTNKVNATAAGLSGSPVAFTETGTPGAAASLAKLSGDAQTGTVSTMLPNPLVAVVKDANGNPVPNVAISFSVTTGGGTLSSASTTTDSMGQGSAKLTLGATAGSNTVTVAVTGLASVVFTETGTAAGAPTMTIVSGNSQTGAVNTKLPNALVIIIKTSSGTLVSGQAVTFSVTSGGGTLTSASTATDATGQASAMLTLGTTAGSGNNAVQCSATGVNGSPLTFTASATAGAAAKLVQLSGDGQSGTAGSALPNALVVQVQDSFANAVQGVTVSFSASAGSVSPASGASDAMGKVSTTLTLANTAGSATVTASSTGLTSVVFNETGVAGPAASIAKVSGDGQTGAVGTALPNPLVVVVTDVHGNAVSGASVTFSVTAGGGSVSPATMSTGSNGQAQTTLTLGAAAGTNTVSATTGSLTPVSFSETGQATVVNRYYTTDIKPILDVSCASCHYPTGGSYNGSDLSTYTAVTTGMTKFGHTVKNYVVNGSPSTSLLYLKVAGTSQGSQMPTSGALSAAQIQIFSDWITQNAPNAPSLTPKNLTKVAGDAQSGPAGSTLPTKLTVQITDASNTPIPGLTVNFAVQTGGGSLSAPSAVTDSTGQAGVSLTLGATAGTNTVQASYGSLTPVVFSETGTASSYSGAPLTGSTNPIDIQALSVLKAANVEPSPLSSDNELVRRVYADLAGRLPTETETMTFVNDTTTNKRAILIDSLLAGTEFPMHWATDLYSAWACVHTGTTSLAAFNASVQTQLMSDTPVSTLLSDLITAGGPTTTAQDATGKFLTTGQIWQSIFTQYGNTQQSDQFMLTFNGQTSECGRCHDHHLTVPGQDDPMWTQDDNYGIYAYVALTSGSATKVDLTGKAFGAPVSCHFVGDGYANTVSSTVVVAGKTVPMTVANTPLATRQATLAGILVNSNAFARGTAHRIWAEVMAPLLDPNQFLATNLNAMSEPGMLSVLTQQFKGGSFSLKSYLRLIMNSKLYQLTTAAATTANDNILARRTVRRHHSEVLEKGMYAVTGEAYKTSTGWQQQFGYPLNRMTTLDRTDAVNIGQAFMLMNSPAATNGLAATTNSQVQTLANQVNATTITLNQAITTLFHYALGRDPSSAELTAINTAETGQTAQVALEDVAVALCCSSEFVAR